MHDKDLVVGEVYFMLTFEDPSMRKPLIITYEYVERATCADGYFEEGFLFKYLPAFRYYDDNDDESFPGDNDPTFFSLTQIKSLLNLSDLIVELGKIGESGYKRD
jgi:hypothetical protein